MKKRYYFIIGAIILILLLIILNSSNKPVTDPSNINWDPIMAQDIPTFSAGWKTTPVRIQANDNGWEDSVFITPDGQRLYFTYYPGDLIGDVSRMKFVGDLDIYYSDYPFADKTSDYRYNISDKIWSAVGPMLTGNDYFYNSNHDYLNDQKADTDTYLNGERLAFNDFKEDSDFGNPHYCAAKDELWFDEHDKDMWILKDAKANNFEGTPEFAPAPLQVNSYANFQPWLSEDCNTIYFSTNRGNLPVQGPAIYTSTRNADDTWTAPTVVAYSKIGVGEPTLTADGKKLFFIQLFEDKDSDTHTSDMFYVERN